MHRIDTPSATAESKFTSGSPSGGVPATTVTADWLNDVQEELVSILDAAQVTPHKGTTDQVLKAILALIEANNPVGVGALEAYAVSSAPPGWLRCNGAAVSRTTYSRLFAAIGTTFGSGDGVSTFNLPELRGEFIRGLDDGRGVDAGRVLGSTQDDALELHSHDIPTGTADSGTRAVMQDDTGASKTSNVTLAAGRYYTEQSGPSGTFAAETRPRNVAFPYYIKF